MKPVFKKVPTLVGLSTNMGDFLEFVRACDLEVELSDGNSWIICSTDTATIKHKGKVIELKDLTVTFEDKS